MKKLTTSFLVCLSWCALHFPLEGISQEHSIIDSLSSELVRLDSESKYDEMLPIANQLTASFDMAIRAKGHHWKGLIYEQTDRYEVSLKSYYKSLELYRSLKDTARIGSVYGNMAIIYYNVKDIKRAEQFMLKAIDHYRSNYHPRFEKSIAGNYTNIGNFYLTAFSDSRNAKHAQIAKNYYERAERMYNDLPRIVVHIDERRLLNSNQLMLYALTGDVQFHRLFDGLMEEIHESSDSLQISLLYSAKAQYYLQHREFDQTITWIDTAMCYFPILGQKSFLVDLYSVKSKALELTNHPKQAIMYRNRADSLKSEMADSETVGNLLAISSEKEKEDIKKASEDRMESATNAFNEREAVYFWIITLSIIASLLAVYLVINQVRKKAGIRNQLTRAKKGEVKTQRELEEYKEYVSTMRNGGELMTEPNGFSAIKEEVLTQVSKDRTLWRYTERVKTIGSGFTVYLKSRHIGLTRNDVRLCLYLLVGLSSKEISSLLNIESASVDRQRYRLRKKLELSQKENLRTFLEDLEHKVYAAGQPINRLQG